MTQENNNKKNRLLQILRERGSRLASEIEKNADMKQLSASVRREIIDELANEFSLHGLQSNSEPNVYGLEIEDLTDWIGLEKD